MNREMKILGIAILSVLILILGALAGIMITLIVPNHNLDNSFFETEPMIILDEDNFEDLGISFVGLDSFNQEQVSIKSLTLNIDEFNRMFNLTLNSQDDLLNYLTQNSYVIESDEYSIFASKNLNCSYNQIYLDNICTTQNLNYFKEENLLYFDIIEFRENDLEVHENE